LDQFLTMRYNTGLTAAPASPFNGSPVCKRSPGDFFSRSKAFKFSLLS
jgi:hypothetical protein